jgi:hypothetical protein
MAKADAKVRSSFDRRVMAIPRGTEAEEQSTFIGLVGDTSYNKGHQPRNDSDDSMKVLLSKWFSNVCLDIAHKKHTYSKLDWFAFFLPCVNWLKGYKVSTFPDDAFQEFLIGLRLRSQKKTPAIEKAKIFFIKGTYFLVRIVWQLLHHATKQR